MRRLFLLALLCMASVTYAQKGSISGIVKDSSINKNIALATISVFKAKDTSIVTYRLSDEDGRFKVPGLPLNEALRCVITYSGYEAFRKEFTLTENLQDITFENIFMISTSMELDEVVITAERPPVTIKNDTIEFNANSFKTLPNALVEDLLKKLPGVFVDKEGNISVNGKPVNRIMVDGKNFFGSDPKMASRNLPANIIDKVQVTDDKEELERNADNNLANVGKVVNITLKKGIKKGIFGKLYAGGGSDDRFEGGGIVNMFRDTLQISLLGYANNLNKTGFTYGELMQAGGLSRSMGNLNSTSTSTSMSSSGGSNITVNGVNFGGMHRGGGISTSKGAGININHSPNNKQSIFGQYFFGNIKVDQWRKSNTKQFNEDTIVTQDNITNANIISNAHNIGLGTKLKPDSVTTIIANATYTLGLQDEIRHTGINSYHNILGELSNGSIDQNNVNNIYNYSHYFTVTRLPKRKAGGRFTFTHGLDASNTRSDFTTNSLTNILYPLLLDSTLQQLRLERIPRTNIYGALVFRLPLNKNFALTASSRYDYNKLNNKVNTFDADADKKYNQLNPLLSNTFNREFHRSNNYLGLQYIYKKLTITPSLTALWQQYDNRLLSLDNSIKKSQFNLLPGLGIVFKELNLNYNKDVSLPAYTNLIPALNNTNPYYLTNGNPNLKPAERDNFRINYYHNNSKKNLNISLYATGSLTKNDVIQSIVVDKSGIQTSTPVNADGSKNATVNYNINKQYKYNSKFTLSWNAGGWYGLYKNKLLYNGETSWQNNFNLEHWAGVNFNFNDKVEWNNDISLSNYQSKFTSSNFSTLKTNQKSVSTEVILRMPKHIIWEAVLQYENNGNVPSGLPKDVTRLSMAVNFTMLKDEKGVLKLSVWDLLNQNNSIGLTTNRNIISATQTNVLGRYFMATFTYNIRQIGANKKKVGGSGIFGY
ncbi:outer membrane beta-barrel protein [Polluticaenibacter yanchengensis]|uniref:Outer membrane beta-barrel protein n=1 Tax=Polluticaenibacter yanchengensis TaxID=3014562 RepID=A0ABT4UF16_9BACT|nr:outer membrane beta-barrel protein [Chitinophagaceae bacterium LY-5]